MRPGRASARPGLRLGTLRDNTLPETAAKALPRRRQKAATESLACVWLAGVLMVGCLAVAYLVARTPPWLFFFAATDASWWSREGSGAECRFCAQNQH